jgi:hypothetical protein
MGLRKPTPQEFLVVGIVSLVGAVVWAAMSHVTWAAILSVVAVGMFWRAWRAGRSSQGAA